MRASEVSEVGREGSPLQVRQRAPNRIAPAGVDRVPQRALGPDEHRARNSELRYVDVKRRLRCAERRG